MAPRVDLDMFDYPNRHHTMICRGHWSDRVQFDLVSWIESEFRVLTMLEQLRTINAYLGFHKVAMANHMVRSTGCANGSSGIICAWSDTRRGHGFEIGTTQCYRTLPHLNSKSGK